MGKMRCHHAFYILVLTYILVHVVCAISIKIKLCKCKKHGDARP
jgi:hypothetical protein